MHLNRTIHEQFLAFRRRALATLVPKFVWPEHFLVDGVSIPIREAPYSFGVKRLICRGRYEAPERELVARILRAGMNVVEMGGSIGVVTAIVASRIQPGGYLVSVEASESLVAFSQTWIQKKFPHVRLVHGFGFPVLELPTGLTVTGFENHGVSLGGQVSYTVSPNSTPARRERHAYDITALCEISGMPSPDVLVADIEGSELILLHSGAGLPSSIQHVVIELHPDLYPNTTDDRDSLIDFFVGQGLSLKKRIGESYLFSRRLPDTGD